MIPAATAFKISRANPRDRWSGGEQAAGERILQRVVIPMGRQSFQAKPSDTFFAIGSCFARNVEERLELAGATVTSRQINVAELGGTSARPGGMFNKYTPVSILQELKWAAGIEAYPEAALLPMGKTLYYDPYLSGKAGQGTKSALMMRRREVATYFAQAFDADIVILTLGLIECWVDRETGLSLNEAPSPKVLARNKDRFAFECLSLEQCEAALEEICAILDLHGKVGQKKIVTISPVPLGRTFTADDIILANTTSKSTLRIAAHRFIQRSENVDYFPSFEAVLHSDQNLAWQMDRRHASDLIVGYIIQTFLARYGIAPEESDDIAAEMALMQKDPAFQQWAADAKDQDALLARMNREINKYKNRIIRLQADLRQKYAS